MKLEQQINIVKNFGRQKWQLPQEFKFSGYQGEMEKIYPLPKSAKEQSTNQSQSKQELD